MLTATLKAPALCGTRNRLDQTHDTSHSTCTLVCLIAHCLYSSCRYGITLTGHLVWESQPSTTSNACAQKVSTHAGWCVLMLCCPDLDPREFKAPTGACRARRACGCYVSAAKPFQTAIQLATADQPCPETSPTPGYVLTHAIRRPLHCTAL